jgi:hypothetical protein
MKLMTPELKARFAEIGDQSQTKDPLVIAKFFNPCGSETWYATEYDAENRVCYGYVTGMFEDEWGTFSLAELEAVRLPFGLSIERDLYFHEKTIRDVLQRNRLRELGDRQHQNEEEKDLGS